MTDLAWISAEWSGALLASLTRAAIQGGLGILAVVLFCGLFPQISARLRCWLWRLAFARLLIALSWCAPLSVPSLPSNSVAEMGQRPLLISANSAGGEMQAVPDPLPAPALDVRMGLVIVWLGGMIWCAGRGLRHLRNAEALRNSALEVRDPRILDVWRELGSGFGLRSIPDLRESPDLESPVCLFTKRATVLLPVNLAADWNDEQIRLMLAHELAHFRRHDLWWSWLPAISHLLFFFHPFVWLANREWRLAHDMAADDLALQITRAPASTYARLLVRVAGAKVAATSGLAMMDARDSSQSLQRRLIAMKRQVNNSKGSSPSHWVLSLLLAAGVLIPVQVIAAGGATLSPSNHRIVEQTGESDAAVSDDSSQHRLNSSDADDPDPAAGARVALPRKRKSSASNPVGSTRLRRSDPPVEDSSVALGELPYQQRKIDGDLLIRSSDKSRGSDDSRLRELEARIRHLEQELYRLRDKAIGSDMAPVGSGKRSSDPLLVSPEDGVKSRLSVPSDRERANSESPLRSRTEIPRERAEQSRKVYLELDSAPAATGKKVKLQVVTEPDLSSTRGRNDDPSETYRRFKKDAAEDEMAVLSYRNAVVSFGSLRLSVQMFRGSGTGRRLLANTDVVAKSGEWLVLEVPSGKILAPSDDFNPESQIRVRVTSGKGKGIHNVEVRTSPKGAASVVTTKTGQPIRLILNNGSQTSPPQVVELVILGPAPNTF